jgi:Tol biopolymer transport system component
MNSDGSGQTNLTNNNFPDNEPAWSPDGSKIVFRSTRVGGFADIYVMNADGSGQILLTNSTSDNYDPAWSPDGTKIAFETTRTGVYDIFTINPDGSNPVNLTNNVVEYYDCFPAWSPDGTKIIFDRYINNNDELYVMNADGSSQTDLTNNPAYDSQPDWAALQSAANPGTAPALPYTGDIAGHASGKTEIPLLALLGVAGILISVLGLSVARRRVY